MRRIEEYLWRPEVPEDDPRDPEDTRMPRSCDWLTDRDGFQQQLVDRRGPPSDSAGLFWVHAKPATEKSVLQINFEREAKIIPIDPNRKYERPRC